MQNLPLVEQVWDVIRDWKNLHRFDLWPADEVETKRKFVEYCFAHDLITLLVDSSGRLEGFLFFYRQPQHDGLNLKRPEANGRYAVCDCLWIRSDLRGKGMKLRELVGKALRENREKILGAEKLLFLRPKNAFKDMFFDFPNFYRKFYPCRAEKAVPVQVRART